MDFYLVTTDHLEKTIWFREDEDFIVGMNAVPLIGYSTGVFVVVFVLMSSHVHFILLCESYEEALKFINEYKRHYSHYLSYKYGLKDTLRRNAVDIQKLDRSGESLERAIADYPWGTGNCFFRVNTQKGNPLGSLSARARYSILHSKKDLPAGLLLGEEGYILPESYILKDRVEAIFKTPKRMQHFLNTSSKARLRLDAGTAESPSFKDQMILPMMQELCWKLFGKKEMEELSSDQLTELFRQMRFRFSSNINQLARLSGLSCQQIAKLL